ncbi:MAG: hypothetical protein FJ335_10630 [Sphingomonadales bacterium]|nr:hypothetical protein [Sphingomonadales bacterium]
MTDAPPHTPDGRYIVVDGILWRATRPDLSEADRQALVKRLMAARRAVAQASTEAETKAARADVDRAKIALGERGPVWWHDGAPDYNRRKVTNTPYADWWARR